MTDTEPTLADTLGSVYDQMANLDDDQLTDEGLPPSDGAASLPRDERGRFQPRAQEAAAATEEIPAEPTAEMNAPDQGGEPPAEPADAQPLSPPARWSAEDKAQFAALPREAQEIVLKREGDVERHLTQKTQEFAETRRQYDALNQILEPRRQAWAMDGMTEQQALTQLFALSDFASQDPAKFTLWFAQQRGVDLRQLAGQSAQAAAPEPGQQPQAASPELAPIINKIQSIEQMLQAEKQEQLSRQQAEINRQIGEFKSTPGHEHFDAVRLEMAALLKSGRASDMQDAYDKAVWANPATRNILLDQQRKADEAKRAEAAKQAAAKAQKSAGVSVSAKASLNRSAPAALTPRETMERVYEQMMGAA